jgi:cytochrome c-type biogenesis protein CcmH
MTLWFVFALMTVAAIFAVLWPLSRGASDATGGTEAAVYAASSPRSIATPPQA